MWLNYTKVIGKHCILVEKKGPLEDGEDGSNLHGHSGIGECSWRLDEHSSQLKLKITPRGSTLNPLYFAGDKMWMSKNPAKPKCVECPTE